jgi:hypothetical protein
MPEIIIADMRKEVRRGNNSMFSSALKEELEKCLALGNQAILFLNRRGYSQTVICKECGYVAKCEACDVSLNYHRDEDCLKCHYCGARYHMLSACPDCGSKKLSYAGTGTQRIEAEIKTACTKARVLRMDNDTTSGKEGHYKILKAFGEKQADILVFVESLEKKHKNAARLSFSTKITDYLRSGKCIFAIGDADIAPIDYFNRYDSAVTACSYEQIGEQLTRLVSEPTRIAEYARKAYDCGVEHHGADAMHRLLIHTITEAANAGKE